MNREICGECKYHVFGIDYNNVLHGGWTCYNYNSDYYNCYTDYTDTCEEWEQRGEE